MARRENKKGGEKWLETRDLIRLVGKIHAARTRSGATRWPTIVRGNGPNVPVVSAFARDRDPLANRVV